MVKTCHFIYTSQLYRFISALHTYFTIKFAFDIDSCSSNPIQKTLAWTLFTKCSVLESLRFEKEAVNCQNWTFFTLMSLSWSREHSHCGKYRCTAGLQLNKTEFDQGEENMRFLVCSSNSWIKTCKTGGEPYSECDPLSASIQILSLDKVAQVPQKGSLAGNRFV